MHLGKLMVRSGSQSWFRLEQLLESVLADVVAVDANFQLTQVQAWHDFGSNLVEFENSPAAELADYSAGFGRLQNLGLSELSVTLPLEVYHPGWWRRAWWGVIQLFGAKVPPADERYRLASDNTRAVIELSVRAWRTENGNWHIKQQS